MKTCDTCFHYEAKYRLCKHHKARVIQQSDLRQNITQQTAEFMRSNSLLCGNRALYYYENSTTIRSAPGVHDF